MNRLKAALQREYEDDPDTTIHLHNPRNTQSVELYFRGEKTAKVMGSLAIEEPKPGNTLSGILVKRNFNYHLLAADDLPSNKANFLFSMITYSCIYRIYGYEHESNNAKTEYTLFWKHWDSSTSHNASSWFVRTC